MKEMISNPDLVAYCGLYCGACRGYLKNKCPGCHYNNRASWCKIRKCCIENQCSSCADCKESPDVNDCRIFNNYMTRMFAFIFRSNKKACIDQIKSIGLQAHADYMAKNKLQSIKRGHYYLPCHSPAGENPEGNGEADLGL